MNIKVYFHVVLGFLAINYCGSQNEKLRISEQYPGSTNFMKSEWIYEESEIEPYVLNVLLDSMEEDEFVSYTYSHGQKVFDESQGVVYHLYYLLKDFEKGIDSVFVNIEISRIDKKIVSSIPLNYASRKISFKSDEYFNMLLKRYIYIYAVNPLFMSKGIYYSKEKDLFFWRYTFEELRDRFLVIDLACKGGVFPIMNSFRSKLY
jgi:hypothetical protein